MRGMGWTWPVACNAVAAVKYLCIPPLILSLLLAGCEGPSVSLDDAVAYDSCDFQLESATCSDGTTCQIFRASVGTLCTTSCAGDADCPSFEGGTIPGARAACESFVNQAPICVVHCTVHADCPASTSCFEYERANGELVGVCTPT